jgi:hypothetical protein
VWPSTTLCCVLSASFSIHNIHLGTDRGSCGSREELQGSGATFAGDKGLSAGLTPPALIKK